MNEYCKGKKFTIGLGMTSLCNMNCSFCYSIQRRTECFHISLTDWIDFFDNNAKFISNINYGTGENTLFEEWYLLIDYINRIDYTIGQALTTNGTLSDVIIQDSKKKEIIDKCISDIDVSLDFGIAEMHNYFRGHSRAYEMAINTLKYCKETGKNTTIVLMGIDQTLEIKNLERVFDIAYKYDALVRINLYRNVNSNTDLLPPEFKIIIQALDWIDKHHEICSLSDPLFASCFTVDKISDDMSGKNSLRILPDGSIYPSTYLIDKKFSLGMIKDGIDLNNIIKNKVIDNIIDIIPEDCDGCEIVNRCKGGAIDRRILVYGTIKKKDPYCPVLHGELPLLRQYKLSAPPFNSIHDGYLPTLFFKAKRVDYARL